MQAKRKLIFDDVDDETVIEDSSDKRRKMNEEEEVARNNFEKWAQRFRPIPKGKKEKKQRKIDSDSDIEVVDATDSAPSTSKPTREANNIPLPTSTNDNLNVFPVKLEEVNVDDIVLQVNLLSIVMNYLNQKEIVYVFVYKYLLINKLIIIMLFYRMKTMEVSGYFTKQID